MLGFLFGLVSVVLLVKVWRGHGRLGRWAHGEDWRSGGWHDDDLGGRRRGGAGVRWFVRRLVDRLDATPAQAKHLREAFEELAGERRTVRGEWRRTRDDVVAILRADEFDAEALTATFARQDAVIEDVRRVFTGSLAKVHATLDPEQRQRLARHLARRGGPSDGDAGPYRGPAEPGEA